MSHRVLEVLEVSKLLFCVCVCGNCLCTYGCTHALGRVPCLSGIFVLKFLEYDVECEVS